MDGDGTSVICKSSSSEEVDLVSLVDLGSRTTTEEMNMICLPGQPRNPDIQIDKRSNNL